MDNYLENISILKYGDQNFVVDKFSGFTKVDYKVMYFQERISITYFIDIYFSGQVLNIKKVNTFERYKRKNFLVSEETKEYKFFENVVSNGLYYVFSNAYWSSGKSNMIISDEIRYFAEYTNTKEALDKLQNEIEYCFKFINDNYSKK